MFQELIHAECMTLMKLGSPVFTLSRLLSRQVAVFAQWENEADIDHFLRSHKLGKELAKGWHIRLHFLRQWGSISGFKIPDKATQTSTPDTPVVAVTVAHMRLLEVPRFLKWGRPVEKQVRDDPGTVLALASIRLPRTISTFSIWKSQKEMTDMVFGRGSAPDSKKHINAMNERDRKDFHLEFTTLRFQAFKETGIWQGSSNIIPTNTSAKA